VPVPVTVHEGAKVELVVVTVARVDVIVTA
jgi:hypothetical protein